MPYFQDCCLRKIESTDLENVLKWRNSDWVRSNMFSDHIITIEEHQAWFERIKQTFNSEYLIFELNQKPAGLVYFTEIDKFNNKCFWGFYLGDEGFPKGTGSILGYLGLVFAFEEIKIRKLCAEVFAFNVSSIKMHNKLGFCEEGRFIKHTLKNGKYEDVISYALFQSKWLEVKYKLKELLFF